MKYLIALLHLFLWAPSLPAAETPPPYAANLFQGNFSKERETAILAPGDRIVLRLWGGGVNMDDILTVDEAGNVSLAEAGTLPVAGLAYDKLADTLKSKLASAGHGDVQVYAAPLDTRPVAIFVTGGVRKPGRYSGSPADPVLAFLDKAGGIDERRGSFRDVRLVRGGKEILTVDLYPFARRGDLPSTRLQEGDTLVVGERGPTVTVSGAARNPARFEFRRGETSGAALLDLAEPESGASHVTLKGMRNGKPYSTYIPVHELKNLQLEDGDRLNFVADAPGDTIMIEVQGAVRGASRFPVRTGARLADVRNYIAVEPERANLEALYIKRKSVAARQKKAIEDSLRRLEEAVFTASSASAEEAQIRAKESEMMAQFIQRAKAVEPEGVVVLDEKGANPALEDGDVIVIPEKSDVVLVSGEVMVPQATVWSRKKDLADYVRSAGGYSNRADRGNVLIMRQNGSVARDSDEILPGDQLLALPRVESKSTQTIKDIAQVLVQVAVSARLVLGLPAL